VLSFSKDIGSISFLVIIGDSSKFRVEDDAELGLDEPFDKLSTLVDIFIPEPYILIIIKKYII